MERTDLRFVLTPTPRGPAAVVGGDAGICGVILTGLPPKRLTQEVLRRWPGAKEDDRGLRRSAAAVTRYFEKGKTPTGSFRLDLDGVGEFRRRVYEALLAIPAGETRTYARIAQAIGHPGAHRAVGSAVARNPIPLFVPCHRVIRTDGSLGGFTAEGGLPLKAAMLALEGVS